MLWWAVTRASGGGHHHVIERFIAPGADANATAAKFGGLIAIQASESDYLDIVKRLVATSYSSMATLSHMAVYEGVLGSLPLLGQFPSGFLEERSTSESATIDPQFQIQAEPYCRSLLTN